MINREILENAAIEYDADKYSEEFYTYHLKELQNAVKINDSVIRAVRYLFLWKLGKIRSQQTPSSSQIQFIDSKGRQFYSIHATKAHYEVIEKAVQKEIMKTAISFRRGIASYDMFKSIASCLTSSTIVLPAFYLHIWRPDKYPILDEKVWKVYCSEEKGSLITQHTKPKSFSDYEAYLSFFKKLVDNTGLDWRTIDKGLWVIGNRLKEHIPSKSVKPTQRDMFTSLDYEKQIKSPVMPISANLMKQAFCAVEQNVSKIPFKFRGIMITHELIKITLELLNAEPTKILPQNSRNDLRERTPDGLDRRIKERLNTDLRTANIISDVLEQSGIVKITQVRNQQTNRAVKGTELLKKWSW